MTRLAQQPVEFVGSFPDPKQVLAPSLPEIAVIGRSNVGKSSLINALAGRKIARTSGTPGKTQLLNAFRFPGFYLIDLPGYGYARLSLAERHRLRTLVAGVVERRSTLRAVLWLLDVRHPPSADDLGIRDLLADTGRETIVALTKADKLPRAQLRRAVAARADELELERDDLVVTSSAKGDGIGELDELIQDAMGTS
ncbi:MAG: ribosome biogenesis GTP-binding protein YsxC [Gemmatimonadetes bacterium]|nr:ribosome biogenesis GTP-binding protein YsxC [Gemmatimonadota bacterium]